MDEVSDDAIAGPWRIYQRRRGHRYSLDDVATAWEAVNARPDARRYLDLGCGIGSVLLMVSYKLERAASISGVEAQDVSIALARKNVERNGVRAQLIHGDLREISLEGPFDLVTGTPPYLPRRGATPSTDEQRTYARIEMRGGIEDYVAAAAKVLAPRGRLIACCDARHPERALDAASAVGVRAVRKRDVVPRAGRKGPLFTVWTFAREGTLREEPPLIARDQDGGRTPMAHALRRFFDLPVNLGEPPSPGRPR